MDLIRELWQYHHWANRRLFEVSTALGEEMTGREVGQQFSFPTLRQMFAHIYGGDWSRLQSWTGRSPTAVPGPDIKTFGELRQRWDELESEQRRFIAALNEDDLGRLIELKDSAGRTHRYPLGLLLLHMPNHATHHRSEIATMLTMVSGSPPGTGILDYHAQKSGQCQA
jgi:uncharacterized damage-inducible protein DinB